MKDNVSKDKDCGDGTGYGGSAPTVAAGSTPDMPASGKGSAGELTIRQAPVKKG